MLIKCLHVYTEQIQVGKFALFKNLKKGDIFRHSAFCVTLGMNGYKQQHTVLILFPII